MSERPHLPSNPDSNRNVSMQNASANQPRNDVTKGAGPGTENVPVMNVRGKRVLVTAGGGGIGRAIAEELAAAGAQVHITDIVEKAIADTASGSLNIAGTLADAANASDVHRVFQDVVGRLDGLDVLVNNVGVAGPTGKIETFSDAEVAHALDVNLRSHFYFLSRFVPLLRQSTKDPSIISISSAAGRLGYPMRTPYAAAKWGIVGLVKSLAVELGPDGIRVNAILPGPVNGPRMDKVIADLANASGRSVSEVRESYVKKISLRRMIEAADVAHLALFLASDLASNITGQAISVDGNVEYL